MKLLWLIVWCLTTFSTVFQSYRGGQCAYPCFPGVLLTSTPHNILSEPLCAFPHMHYRNNGQRWERNESCRNDYHQSSKSRSRGSNLLFFSPQRYRLSYEVRRKLLWRRGSVIIQAVNVSVESSGLSLTPKQQFFILFQTERVCRQHF